MQLLVDHLVSRHLDVILHRPVVDEENRVATFYLWNLSGQLVGYQQYRPEGPKTQSNDPKRGKYYTYRKQPTLAVWGVESLYRPGPVYLCEGIFDACRLTDRGVAALAVLSNHSGHDLVNWLICLGRVVVAVCDNDSAGKKLATLADYSVTCVDKDLGDSSDDFVTNLLNQHKHVCPTRCG